MKTTVSIPEPCSENWNNMTPTEKGAFCDKCSLEVLDFTSMTPEEIRGTLKARSAQRTCGHISRTQIDLVNTDYHVWENQSVRIFRSKFLYACLMVFGFALFTGCNRADEQVVGEMEYIQDDSELTGDTVSTCVDDDVLDGVFVCDGADTGDYYYEVIEGEIAVEPEDD